MNLTDDPYCEACFKTIHAKGKKARHKWTPIGEEKVSEDTGQAEGEYNAGGEGGASPAGGSADIIPNIRSSDNSNTLPALAGSMFNIADF